MTLILLPSRIPRTAAQPCPGWCRSGESHADQLLQLQTSFFHQGDVHFVASQHLDLDGRPALAEIYLCQQEDVDEEGQRYRHSVSVILEGANDFTPDQARNAAALLRMLAEIAGAN